MSGCEKEVSVSASTIYATPIALALLPCTSGRTAAGGAMVMVVVCHMIQVQTPGTGQMDPVVASC